MASDIHFAQYVADQLSQAGTVTFKKMFGEYGFYLDEKFFGSVCDNQLFIKITNAGRALAPALKTAPPYDGAKECFLFEDLDDRDFLVKFVLATCSELPAKKKKSK